MRAAFCLLAVLSCASHGWAADTGSNQAPSYSAASIVNAASNLCAGLAPNTIATIYGEGLAYVTRAVTPGDVSGGVMPTVLGGTGVQILIENIPAHVFYVSPTQINLLIPSTLTPGRRRLQVLRNGFAGPAVEITLKRAAPALFQLDETTAVATTAGGSVVTWDSPAHPGGIVVLYATGLGETEPPLAPGQIAPGAALIRRLSELRVLLNGIAVDPGAIAYAGVTPGFAGLYQINLWLPARLDPDPEIRVAIGGEISPPGIRLPVR